MSIRPIIQLREDEFYSRDTLLRKRSQGAQFDGKLVGIIEDLIDTLNDHSIAVGLSAPQIGILSRVTVINTRKKEKKVPLVLVNPEIISVAGESVKRMEACMSLPYFQGEVERSSQVKLKYRDASGEEHELGAEGFLARVIFHELDHLDGILYVDRMPSEGKLVPAEFFNNDKSAKEK